MYNDLVSVKTYIVNTRTIYFYRDRWFTVHNYNDEMTITEDGIRLPKYPHIKKLLE